MSRRRISTRASMTGMRNSDIAPTDEGGFNALQNSNLVLTPSRGLESSNQLSYRETDCSDQTLPTDWPNRIKNSSIGLADNNKENNTKKSAKGSDIGVDDLPLVDKRHLIRRRHLKANYGISSSSDTDNDFEKILSGHIKASQQVDDPNNDISSPEKSERIQSPIDIELKRKTIPRRRIGLKLSSSDSESDADIFGKILSGQVKPSQQELRQDVEADEHHDSMPSDAQHSSAEADSVVSAMETRLSCRQEKSMTSHQLSSREEDINLSNASVTLKESIIYHKHNSSTESEEQLDNIRDNQEGYRSRASEQIENSPSIPDDVSVHTSDQSSRSGFLQNANFSNKRRTSTLTPMNKSGQSDLKETSSISIHESDRDISSIADSASGSSNVSRSKTAIEKSVSQKPDNARQRQTSLSSSGRSSGKSLALIELELNRSQSKTKQQISVIKSNEQASRQLDIHDEEMEMESLTRNRSKRKKIFEEDSVALDESVIKKTDAMSASKLIRPCCIPLERIPDTSENLSRSLRSDRGRSKNDHNQTLLIHSANISSSTKKKQDKTLRSKSRESLILEKSPSKHSQTRKKISFSSDSEDDVDQSHRATTSRDVLEMKSVAESGKNSMSNLSDSSKKSTIVSSTSEDEDADQIRKATASLGVSKTKSVAESEKSSMSKLNESSKKLTMVNSDSEGEDADQIRRPTASLGVSKTKSVAESEKNSMSKLNESSKKLTMVNSDSEDDDNLFRRKQTSIKVPKVKKVAESGNGSLSKLSDSRKQMTLLESDSQSEDVDLNQQTPVSTRVPEAKDTLKSSVQTSRKKRTSNHEIDEEEKNVSIQTPAKKSKRDVSGPADNTLSSPVASTSYHQSQSRASKRSTMKKVPLKPIQPTLDGYLTRAKKLPPSELGLKYKSLQDFDKQHNEAELSQEIQELRLQLLNDPYIMQETSRIARQQWDAKEEQRREKEKAKEMQKMKKIRTEQLEIKKKAAEERKRKREEQFAKISDDYKVKGKVYKPRLAQPKKWCTTRLYEELQKKMEPIHGIETRLKSEKLMRYMVQAVDFITKTAKYDDYKECLDKLKIKLARNGIVVTHDDFWLFAYNYLPYSFRVKAVPMTLPGNVETIPNWDPTNDEKPILGT